MSTRVLIADDDLITGMALDRNLKAWGYEVFRAKNGQEAWDIIQKNDIDLAILDWMMPDMDGIKLTKLIRQELQEKKSKYIYIILLSGSDGYDDVVHGLSLGADDYLTKPYSITELKIRLQNGERLIKIENERFNQASFDPVTKLWTRRRILEFLDDELSRASREHLPTGLILIGVDQIYGIELRRGMFVSDQILGKLADRLKKDVRRYDRAGRFAENKFLIILSACSQTDVETIAQRLHHSLTRESVFTEATPMTISVHFGCVSSDPLSPQASANLILACEDSLRNAKKAKQPFLHNIKSL